MDDLPEPTAPAIIVSCATRGAKARRAHGSAREGDAMHTRWGARCIRGGTDAVDAVGCGGM
eukprot:1645547-Prymnesium_polylepis.1